MAVILMYLKKHFCPVELSTIGEKVEDVSIFREERTVRTDLSISI